MGEIRIVRRPDLTQSNRLDLRVVRDGSAAIHVTALGGRPRVVSLRVTPHMVVVDRFSISGSTVVSGLNFSFAANSQYVPLLEDI